MPTEEKMMGTVKFWDADRGFGFVIPDAGGEDLFCHIRSLPEHIEDCVRGSGSVSRKRRASISPGSSRRVPLRWCSVCSARSRSRVMAGG